MTEEKVYTPPPVTGYNPLTGEQIQLMNKIKAYFEEFNDYFKPLLIEQATTEDSQECLKDGLKHLRNGAMLITRSITKPTTLA